MVPVSVVIITKNEAEVIAATINAAQLITDDVIIIDNGSIDQTLAIASASGCRIYQNSWTGYGANKNRGIELARYDWILSIDADEIPDADLIRSLHSLKWDNATVVYDVKFRSYFGKKLIRFGHWGRDHHIRLFNRKQVRWSEPTVHEKLLLPQAVEIKKLNGYIHHYSVKNTLECATKAIKYAKLSAERYFWEGKKTSVINLYISPVFGFLVNYIIFLGILDGKEGWAIAKYIFKNKWLKYHYLNELENTLKKKQFINNVLAAEY